MNIKNLENTMGNLEIDNKQKSAEKFDIEELIKNALGPERWIEHLNNDLMKFWGMEEAKNLQGDFFPTYRTNKGEVLSKDRNEWPEEFKAALLDPVTKGLV